MLEPILQRISDFKRRRNAVILAHNYQLPEVQDVADFVGDSLDLSRKAAGVTNADVIVFCGVHFMAETAAILNPAKTVLLPDPDAGCPMADMISVRDLRELKRAHPDAAVVCYINSTAEVKAESDCCCTSANAVAVVNSMEKCREIIFIPDKYLGQHVSNTSGRQLILWHGYCPTHVRILDARIAELKARHPGAVAMAHPECTQPVRDIADEVFSTGGMCRYVRESPAREFIVATEIGLIHRLKKENPDKSFYAASDLGVCPNMKRIRLEKILWSLEGLRHEIRVPADIAAKARRAINRMLALAA